MKSQNSFFQIEGGIALPLSSSSVDGFRNVRVGDNNRSFEDAVCFSLGEGNIVSLTAGGMLYPGIIASFRVQNILSRDVLMLDESAVMPNIRRVEGSLKTNIWVFNPELRLYLPDLRLSPFMSFGINFASGRVRLHEKEEHLGKDFRRTYDYTGKFSVNPTAAGGLFFNLNEKIQLTFQCRISPMTYVPTRAVMTTATVNGGDNLSSFTVIERETEFVDSFEKSLAPDPGKPEMRLSQMWAAGGIQLTGGVVFMFGRER